MANSGTHGSQWIGDLEVIHNQAKTSLKLKQALVAQLLHEYGKGCNHAFPVCLRSTSTHQLT